ncbi:MAG: dipeptidase [Lachnospiraceae bacterium]
MKVVDMHCDTISELYQHGLHGGNADIWENEFQLDLQKMIKGDYLLQNFALFVHLGREKQPFTYAMKLVDTFYTQLEPYSRYIGIVKNYQDIEENMKQGKMSALLTLEEGGVCQGDLGLLRDFYRLGVRMMTLTWNFPNELGFPNKTVTDASGNTKAAADTENGLTDTGIAFVREMERLGMIIDVSHLNDAGIWDVLKYTKGPIVASHSNARALASHPRNLTDDMIRAIADRGGVIGINYYSAFLRDWKDGEEPTGYIDDMIAHIKHIKSIGGIGCIGLGSDFDGSIGKVELESSAELPKLEAAMERNGFTKEEIEAVFYKNVLRLYREVL